MMERWTWWVLQHRKTILALWIGLFVIGGWAASGLSSLLTNRFTLPGTDAGRAENIRHTVTTCAWPCSPRKRKP